MERLAALEGDDQPKSAHADLELFVYHGEGHGNKENLLQCLAPQGLCEELR